MVSKRGTLRGSKMKNYLYKSLTVTGSGIFQKGVAIGWMH